MRNLSGSLNLFHFVEIRGDTRRQQYRQRNEWQERDGQQEQTAEAFGARAGSLAVRKRIRGFGNKLPVSRSINGLPPEKFPPQ